MSGPSTAGITGYRNLSDVDKQAMNDIKALENRVGELLQDIGQNPDVDPRILAMAISQLQVGFMLAVRSVAQPQSALRPIVRR